MTSKEVGEFIATLRKESGLTQKQIAEKINVSDKAISRWETGKGYPDVTSLVALSDFFGISINELLAGKQLHSENIKEVADENIIAALEETEKIKKSKLHIDTKIFCFATVTYWICALVIYFISAIFTLEGIRLDGLYYIWEFLATSVVILSPVFGYIIPIILIVSVIFHSVRDRSFKFLSLFIILANLVHPVFLTYFMDYFF